MFEVYDINYNLNGASFEKYETKQELKRLFLQDYITFMEHNDKSLVGKFNIDELLKMRAIELGSLKVGEKLFSSYFLENNTPIEKQSKKSFIGYLLITGLYPNLVGHLIAFFYRWRDLEEVDDTPKAASIDFWYSSWASFVDSFKYFDYNDGEDVIKARDSGLCARDVAILEQLKYYPQNTLRIPYKTNRHLETILFKPFKEGYEFDCWVDEANNKITNIPNEKDVTVSAIFKKL